MRVAQAVGETLAQLGVRQVSGLIGSGNFAATNALVAAGASFVAARHEGAAITIADAYSRVSGEVGVCSVHQGPGLTNAVTGLTEAAKSRTPLLLLAADNAAAAVRSNFRIDQDGLVGAVGAIPERVHTAESAVADVVRSFRRAQLERRPVVLMLPLDVQAADCRPAPLSPAPRLYPVRPAMGAVQEAATALTGASRPLIIAGRGATLANAREPLEELGERVGALLATSAVANGLFMGSPWALGISGGFASPVAAGLIAASDVVLAVGVALNMWTTSHGRLLSPDAVVVQVDSEAVALGAHHRVDVGVVGDAAETARALVEELRLRDHRGSGWRTPEVERRLRLGSWRQALFEDQGTGERIDPRALSIALDEVLPAERTVVVDSGHFMGWPAMYLRVPDPAGFVFTQAFQAVGLGLASAIGAAVARPERLTVAALGDGGALMGLSELETVCRLGLRMLIVVYNDAAYGAEVHHFGPDGASLDLVRFPDTDFAALARGAGLEAVTVRRREDLGAVAEWVGGPRRPALLADAKVVPTVVAEWLDEAFRGH